MYYIGEIYTGLPTCSPLGAKRKMGAPASGATTDRDGFFSFRCRRIPVGVLMNQGHARVDPMGFVLVFCLTTSLVSVLGITTGLVDPTTSMLDPKGVLLDPSLPLGFTFFRLMGFNKSSVLLFQC